MSRYKALIRSTIQHWNSLPKDAFITLYNKGLVEVVLIKFREAIGQKNIYNETEPWIGIKFIDILCVGDYFLGEFILVNKAKWKVIVNSQSVVLQAKNSRLLRESTKTEKIRDDGFVKTYKVVNNSLVIAKV